MQGQFVRSIKIIKKMIAALCNIKKIVKAVLPPFVRKALRHFYYKMYDQLLSTESYEVGHYPFGINLTGYIYSEMGLGQGCRCIAHGLQESGIPFSIVNYCNQNARSEDYEWKAYVGDAKYAINLVQINPDGINQARIRLGKNFWDKRYQISHFSWELPIFPSMWKGVCDYFNEIWTPSDFCTEAIAGQTKVPVYTMPYVIQPEISTLRNRTYFKLPKDKFLFLCMFDINSAMERKNPIGAIDAYLKAFSDSKRDENVGLVIKINNFLRRKEDYKALYQRIINRPDIYIIDEVFSKNDVNALISVCDCFVSLHRSEGFGLVLAEAMYFEKPVIATNWSANIDFMNKNNSCVVDYRLIPLERDYAVVYQKGQMWADPSIEHCAHYMQQLYADKQYYQMIANAGQQSIKKQCSSEVSANFILDRVRQII